MMGLSELDRRIYQRNILLPQIGEAGQVRLARSKVLIVGLGGLGSPALFYLASCGIGRIGVVDFERVDWSNLQRQILYGFGDVGREKILAARKAMERLRMDLEFDLFATRLNEDNAADILGPYEFIIEATDNFESKFLINDYCVKLGKPFSHAGILGVYGQAMTVIPGESPCFRCVFESVPPPGAAETTDEVGVLGTVAGVMGAVQATEAVKYLLGSGDLLTGRLLTFDAWEMIFREVALPPRPLCPVCGSRPQG